jgi:hypothetical protein
MSSSIADGVLAATHRLVQQAMSGQWADVPRTIEERRALLDRLSATATPNDQQWLGALKQAMAESDAAVARMQAAAPIAQSTPAAAPVEAAASEAAVDSLMDMIVKGR